MTPKEKAKELLEKYDDHCWISPINQTITRFHKTQCALICVNEIINQLESLDELNPNIKYWLTVKDELNTL